MDDIPIVAKVVMVPVILEEVMPVSEIENVVKIMKIEGAAPLVSPWSGSKLPLEVGFGS